MARPKRLSADEIKTARTSVIMPPKLYADVTTLAQIQRVSVNDFFNSLAAQAIERNREAIDEVQAVMAKYAVTRADTDK